MVVPIVDQIAAERSDIKVCKINVDEEPELAARYDIMTIPTLMVMENGIILHQSAGAKTKDQILNMLK
jgi:thioredoxin 1